MSRSEQITRAVLACVEDVNTQMPDGAKLRVDVDCPVLGPGSVLDSLGLLNLLVAVEERLSAELGLNVDLLDEDLLADRNGPLRTVGTLIDHVEARS
jgi:acyl carrier protein